MSEENRSFLQDKSYWLVQLQQTLTMRRGTMYRMLSSSLQLLLLGNAGGIGFIMGMFRSGTSNEPVWIHWMCIAGIISYSFGCMAAALTVIFSNYLAMKEAHAAEDALINYSDNKMNQSEALTSIDKSTFSIAASAMISGLCSLGFLVLGTLIGIVVLIFYY
jgi:hypothetical protein